VSTRKPNLMAVPLETTISRTGVQQSDLVKFMENLRDVVNELQADHATLLADVTAIRTAVTGITAQLDADAGVTDTDYAANNDPAALTTVTLTNSTALTLNKG